MNKSRNRLTRATIAIGSFITIVALGVPWVDEYLQRRRDAKELVELRGELEQSSLRGERLSKIASNMVESMQKMQERSIQQSEAAEVRELLTEVVRKSGARLRHIDTIAGHQRPWGLVDDDVRKMIAPESGRESGFLLTTVTIDLRAVGSVESINKISEDIADQGWLMSTTSLVITPAEGEATEVSLEIRFTAYGLELAPETPMDEFAMLHQQRGRT